MMINTTSYERMERMLLGVEPERKEQSKSRERKTIDKRISNVPTLHKESKDSKVFASS